MSGQYLLVVHAINVISGQHDDKLRAAAFQHEQILVNRIGSPLIPGFSSSQLRWDSSNVFTQLRVED
jgi:hypothetical protein